MTNVQYGGLEGGAPGLTAKCQSISFWFLCRGKKAPPLIAVPLLPYSLARPAPLHL